jgi:hypothetical protein
MSSVALRAYSSALMSHSVDRAAVRLDAEFVAMTRLSSIRRDRRQAQRYPFLPPPDSPAAKAPFGHWKAQTFVAGNAMGRPDRPLCH